MNENASTKIRPNLSYGELKYHVHGFGRRILLKNTGAFLWTALLLFVIAAIVGILAHGGTENCTLTVSISPPGAGFVTPTGGKFSTGSEVTLTAMPVTGCKFDRWGGAMYLALRPRSPS